MAMGGRARHDAESAAAVTAPKGHKRPQLALFPESLTGASCCAYGVNTI